MAEPSPWQVAQAGQKIPVAPVKRVIFSRGTEPWPYAPHYIEVPTNGSNATVVYGVNTHQPPPSDG